MPQACCQKKELDLIDLMLQSEHEAVLREMVKEAERGAKLEKKLEILTHGYVTREKALKGSILTAFSALQVTYSLTLYLLLATRLSPSWLLAQPETTCLTPVDSGYSMQPPICAEACQ